MTLHVVIELVEHVVVYHGHPGLVETLVCPKYQSKTGDLKCFGKKEICAYSLRGDFLENGCELRGGILDKSFKSQ